MSSKTGSSSTRRRFSPEEQAAALAVVLQDEFSVPFRYFHAQTGARVTPKGRAEPEESPSQLPPEVHGLLLAGEPAWVDLLPNHRFQVMLVFFQGGEPSLVALGTLPILAQGRLEILQEQERVHRWVKAVGDRLRLADQVKRRGKAPDHAALADRAKLAWEVNLQIDYLLRRLRIYKEPAKNHHRVLRAAQELLGVQALAWLAPQATVPTLLLGDFPGASPNYRQLAACLLREKEDPAAPYVLCNDVASTSWGGQFPQIGNVLALSFGTPDLPHWVIAINKKEGKSESSLFEDRDQVTSSSNEREEASRLVAFRRTDAAVLTPFAGLLDMYIRNAGRYLGLRDLMVGLARSLAAAIDAKDSYTFGHSERVARIAMELGRELGLLEEELGDLYLAGLLHDIGKIGVPDALLAKKGLLTPEEFEQIKPHSSLGYSMLKDLKPIHHLLPGIRNHHERFDGTGYPDGLKGETIPLIARIIAVADSYDAMTTDRPYRDSMSLPQVEATLSRGLGSQWDPRVIEGFLRCRHRIHGIRQRGLGESFRVALDNALRGEDSAYSQTQVAAVEREPSSPP